MNRKAKFLTGSAIIVLAVGALIYTAVRETSAYYMTVDEYAVDPGAHAGQPLRLAGRVAPDTVKWDPRTLDLEFLIQPIPPRPKAGEAEAEGGAEAAAVAVAAVIDPAARLPVRYNGILPDMFAADRDVIVEGRVQDGVFHARTLLTTCPSKYEAELEESKTSGSEPAPHEAVAAAR